MAAHGDRVKVVDRDYDALDGAHALVLLTEWRSYRAPNFGEIRKRLRDADDGVAADRRRRAQRLARQRRRPRRACATRASAFPRSKRPSDRAAEDGAALSGDGAWRGSSSPAASGSSATT